MAAMALRRLSDAVRTVRARDWWPCKQDLNDKIIQSTFILLRQRNTSVSNGLQCNDDERLKQDYALPSRLPDSAYLVAFAVSNYRDLYGPQNRAERILDHQSCLSAILMDSLKSTKQSRLWIYLSRCLKLIRFIPKIRPLPVRRRRWNEHTPFSDIDISIAHELTPLIKSCAALERHLAQRRFCDFPCRIGHPKYG